MTLSDSQLAAAKARAEAWFRDGSEVALTRDNAINEEHLALDIIELLAEIERLRAMAARLCDHLEMSVEIHDLDDEESATAEREFIRSCRAEIGVKT